MHRDTRRGRQYVAERSGAVMPYSEMDNRTFALLPLISERARKEPKLQFTSLAHLLNEKFLRECYMELGRDRARGIDGVSWQAYGENLDESLSNLVKRMKAKQYKPQPAKRVYIPKNEHEKRPLGLPSLEDKVVQKGISRIRFIRLMRRWRCGD